MDPKLWAGLIKHSLHGMLVRSTMVVAALFDKLERWIYMIVRELYSIQVKRIFFFLGGDVGGEGQLPHSE